MGIEGSGKSTIARLLNKRGHCTNDIDDGYARWINKESGLATAYDPNGGNPWLAAHSWRLNDKKLVQWLSNKTTKSLFVVGDVGGITNHFHLFDVVFLLKFKRDEDVRRRLTTRTTNDYGKHPDELALSLSRYKTYQEAAVSKGAVPIDCTLDPHAIVTKIEELAL